MANHLIIGGNGYVGLAMTKFLLEKGESVRVLDISNPKKSYDNVDYKLGSICDKEIIKESLEGIDYVHFYAVYIPLYAKKKDIERINIDGLKNVLDQTLNSGAKKVFIVSSSGVYGANKEVPITDECEAIPLDTYGEVRLQAEKIAIEYSKKNLNVIIFRPHIIAGGDREGIFKNIFKNIYNNKNVWLPSTSKYIHQFVHIDDLINAISLCFNYDKSEIFNIGQEMENTMYELIQKVIIKSNSKSKIKIVPKFIFNIIIKVDSVLKTSFLGPNKILVKDNGFYFDCSKIKKKINWKEKYSDYEIVEESYYNYVENNYNKQLSNTSKNLYK